MVAIHAPHTIVDPVDVFTLLFILCSIQEQILLQHDWLLVIPLSFYFNPNSLSTTDGITTENSLMAFVGLS